MRGVKSKSEESEKNHCKIFISHRHRDEPIADALREQLQSWSIPSESIFQSSSYRNSGKIGHSINSEISEFLEEARLVILIYTYPDEYWDYCMFECGLAMNPKTPETSVIVFQCTEYLPRVFQDKLLVLANSLDGIRRFVNQFHREAGFFPESSAYDPGLSDENLETLSSNLFNAIQAHLPKKKPEKSIRWGYFTLRINTGLVDMLQDAENIQDACDLCITNQEEIPVVDAAGFGLRHFGYQNFDSKLTFKKLIDCWYATITEELSKQFLSEANVAWIRELIFDICRSIRNESPRLSWIPLRSAFQGIDWRVCPVINEVQYAYDGSAELRVYMYRMDKIDDIDKNIAKRTFFSKK